MAKSIKLTNDTYLDSKSIHYKDYTSELTFVNCKYKSGQVFKIGKLVFFKLYVEATASSDWGTIIKMPIDLNPVAMYDYGQPITGCNFWAYSYARGSTHIEGTYTSGTSYWITGFYLADR